MSVRLIGGEMLGFSDLDGTPGPVRGPALAPLVTALAGRILVVGPHAPTLVDEVPSQDLTILVRAAADAESFAARYADRPGVTVCCGAPEKLADHFDTIVALDGVARLCSAEGAQLGWAAAVELLLGLLRPGGLLLLGVENHLGVHRLAALPPSPTDADWSPVADYDPTRPAGLANVLSHLAALGLAPAATFAAYPTPVAPAALLGPALLADDKVTGFVAASLTRRASDGIATEHGALLADPARLALRALRHGAAADLAPGWIFAAHRAPASAPEAVRTPEIEPAAAGRPDTVVAGGGWPDAVVAGDGGRWVVTPNRAGGWVRRGAGVPGSDELGDAVVPTGRTLEDLLIAATLGRDLPAVRELLVVWESGAAAGVPADQVVVGADGGLTALAAGEEPDAALVEFAATLVRGGFAHPWPAPGGVVDIAGHLAVMAGRELSALDVPEATGVSLREVVAERDRLTRELAEARAKAEWYERALAGRDNALTRAQRLIELLSARGPARLGMAMMGGARVARRSVRGVVRGLRPRA